MTYIIDYTFRFQNMASKAVIVNNGDYGNSHGYREVQMRVLLRLLLGTTKYGIET